MTMRIHFSPSAIRTFVLGAAVLASGFFGVAQVQATTTTTRGATSWTVYHGNTASTGVSSALKSVTTNKRAWTSPMLSGAIYGEPLVYSGDVFVATENDTVYALTSSRGSVVWSRHLASAVPVGPAVREHLAGRRNHRHARHRRVAP